MRWSHLRRICSPSYLMPGGWEGKKQNVRHTGWGQHSPHARVRVEVSFRITRWVSNIKWWSNHYWAIQSQMLIHPIVPDSSNPIRFMVARNQIRIARAIKGRIILMIWTIYDICYQIDFSDLYQHDWFHQSCRQQLPMMSEAGILPQSPNAKYGMIPESNC